MSNNFTPELNALINKWENGSETDKSTLSGEILQLIARTGAEVSTEILTEITAYNLGGSQQIIDRIRTHLPQ